MLHELYENCVVDLKRSFGSDLRHIAAKHVLRYIKGTVQAKMVITPEDGNKLPSYAYALPPST